MSRRTGSVLTEAFLMAALALAIPLAFTGGNLQAATQYLDDGGLQNALGGWDLPAQGTCPVDLTMPTRPDCLSRRFQTFTSSATCQALVGGVQVRSWSTGVCNDLFNNADQTTCEGQPDRRWNPPVCDNPAYTTQTDCTTNGGTWYVGICSVVMKGDDRNNVVCALHGGTWVTAGTCIGNWIMPARTAYNPPLLSGNGPGDQCLRCHNSVTEYNGPRIRDVDWFLRTGHANMARKVVAPNPWAGPAYECSDPAFTTAEDCVDHGETWERSLVVYPSDDSANPFNWTTGQIGFCSNALYKTEADCTTNGGTWTWRDLTWIYGDWLAPLPRAIYKAPASTSQVCDNPLYTTANCVANGGTLINNAGASYSCGRCHTTGWTSDATINVFTDIQGKEPELSFPGITWDRISNAGFGVVNLTGGVTGDANKYSSWDTWGITCSRCHQSAIDTNNPVAGSSPTQYNAPAGMSSHHNSLTGADAGSGYCSDIRFTAQAQCDAAGAAWLTACSVAGVCSNPTYTTSGTCLGGGGTWTSYNASGTCTGGGGTWYTSSCSVAGICNLPLYIDQATCEAQPGGQWAAVTDVIRCEDAGGRWSGSRLQRGQLITRLCMDCHRQETGGMPYANTSATAGTESTVNPGLFLKVGPAHGTFGFVSHPHGNQFLNSPHGKFTGLFNQIAMGKFNFAMTGEYKSFFMTEGEAANTGNGCTGCHDIHKSVVEEAFEPLPEQEGAIHEECTECHAKNLSTILHPAGGGTPLEEKDEEPFETCVACHMPGGLHLFRINVDPGYETYATGAITATSSAQCTALGGTWSSSTGCTLNANTADDDGFASASWVDLDAACGQCHGGGTNQATTTGTIASGSKSLTVASTTGFVAGARVRVAGAGALEYDDEGLGRGDFDTYIVSVGGPTTLNLVGAPSLTVSDAAVVQNPTKNNAGYMSKSQLATLAANIHNDKPQVTFGTSLGSPNTLLVNLDASASTCSGDAANCDAYEWDCGAGGTLAVPPPPAKAVTASCTFTTGGAKPITLTVHEYGVNEGSKTKNVTVYAPDLPPTVAGDCQWNADTWTMTLVDASTDDVLLNQVTVNWGDGSMLGNDTTAPFGPFSRTYVSPGNFTITHKAIDSLGQQSTRTCAAAPTWFTISGTVFAPDGTTPLSTAALSFRRNGTLIKVVYTAGNGTFTAGLLKPGTYSVTVNKTGYTFANPAASGIVIGPNYPGLNITATGVLSLKQTIDSRIGTR